MQAAGVVLADGHEQRVRRDHVAIRQGLPETSGPSRPLARPRVGQVVVVGEVQGRRSARQTSRWRVEGSARPSSCAGGGEVSQCPVEAARCVAVSGAPASERGLLDCAQLGRWRGDRSVRVGGSGAGCCGGHERRAGRARPGRRPRRSGQAAASRARTSRPRRRGRRRSLTSGSGSAVAAGVGAGVGVSAVCVCAGVAARTRPEASRAPRLCGSRAGECVISQPGRIRSGSVSVAPSGWTVSRDASKSSG